MVRRVLQGRRAAWRAEIARTRTWLHAPTRRAVELAAAVACGAALLDGAVSWLALRGSLVFERNPVADAMIRSLGLGPAMAFGTSLRIGTALALAFLATRAVRRVVRLSAATALLASSAWWSLVVFSNAVVIGRLRGVG
jgi:hypothetical protein